MQIRLLSSTKLWYFQRWHTVLLLHVTSIFNNTAKERIERIKKRGHRLIGPSINVPTVTSIRHKHICTFVFKGINEDVCENFKDYFQIQVNDIDTRHNGRSVRLPKVRLEVGRKSFYYQGRFIFNKLPLDIRKAPNLSYFKKLVCKIKVWNVLWSAARVFSLWHLTLEWFCLLKVKVLWGWLLQRKIKTLERWSHGVVTTSEAVLIIHMCWSW